MGGGASCCRERRSSGRRFSLNDIPPPPPKDPRLPLTVRQKFNLLKSWKAISRAMDRTGVYMFIKLFEDHELLSLFQKFVQLRNRDEQAESLELAEHASIVMNTLDEAIKALEDMTYFFSFLHEIGQSHRHIPGFKVDYFLKIKHPFLEAVKMTLGDAYTDNMDNIYRITIDFILETLSNGFNTAPTLK